MERARRILNLCYMTGLLPLIRGRMLVSGIIDASEFQFRSSEGFDAVSSEKLRVGEGYSS